VPQRLARLSAVIPAAQRGAEVDQRPGVHSRDQLLDALVAG